MTIYEYYQLSRREQLDLLYSEGVFLLKRREGDRIFLLYQLDSFYIEIAYKKYRSVIQKMKCFHSIDLLAPYMEEIDVEGLLKYAH